MPPAVGHGRKIDADDAADAVLMMMVVRWCVQVKSLKKKLEELTKDNGDLLCAVKYLKSKMEQKDSASRCATPTVAESSRSVAGGSLGREVHPLSLAGDHDTRALRDKCSALERELARLRQRATAEGLRRVNCA